jgi:DNA mismatch repair protein MutS
MDRKKSSRMTQYIKKLDNKKKVIEQYLELQVEYETLFGEKTIVLYENGTFFEFYQVGEKGKASQVCEILNILLTKKNKSIPEVTMDNPHLAGFPTVSIKRHLHILMNEGWIVVLVEQLEESAFYKEKERAVTHIYSKSTYIDIDEKQTNYTMCVFLKEEEYKFKKYLRAGWSLFDFSTGTSYFSEIVPAPDNEFYSTYEELQKVISAFQPSQYLLHFMNTSETEETFKERFRLISGTRLLTDVWFTIAYQEHYLSKCFKNTSVLTTIEWLHMEDCELARASFVSALRYIEQQQSKFVSNLLQPVKYTTQQFIQLENNAIEQLQLYVPNTQSLFHLLDQTSTQMGRRMFLYRLLHPLVQSSEIEKRYEYTNSFLPIYKEVESVLKHVVDIERLHRKIGLDTITPSEAGTYYMSLASLRQLPVIPLPTYIAFQTSLERILTFFEDTYQTQELQKYYLNKITTNLFLKDESVHSLWNQYKMEYDAFEEYVYKISSDIRIEKSDDEFVLKTTPKRGEILKSNKDIVVDTRVKSYSKITNPTITSFSNKLVKLLQEIDMQSLKRFKETIRMFYDTYSQDVMNVCNCISEIDFFTCLAKNVNVYNLHRPTIKEHDRSYIKATDIRHLIVESISKQPFVMNDCDLQQQHGMLVFGINGIGKSVYIKSVALCIVMAQAGMYVPCTSFEYCPFTHILTRILNNDNIYKGYSSFMVEMIELNNILRTVNERSLVIADELTHGTEIYSGTSIIVSTLLRLLEKRSTFLFTTHLHTILEIEEIQTPLLGIFHMNVIYDSHTDSILYERKLLPGSGEPIYGLECCKALHLPTDFLETAHTIRKRLLHQTEPTQSKYNAKVIVEKCFLCNKNDGSLHTHHIQEQHLANDHGWIDGVHKNNLHNLLVLCESCHQDVHSNRVTIEGWKFTSKGNTLVFKYNQLPSEIKSYIEENKDLEEKILVKNIQQLFHYKIKKSELKNTPHK